MQSRCVPSFALLALAFHLLPAPAASQQILGISPALPTSADELTISVARPNCTYTQLGNTTRGTTITLTLNPSPEGCPPIAPGTGPFNVAVFSVPPVLPGAYTVVLLTDGAMTDSRSVAVQAPANTLSLLQGRFTGTVSWQNPFSGATVPAAAVQVADGSGYFWFFSAGDVDLTIKMIGPTSPIWFFASSGTNVEFTITVLGTWLNKTVSYQNPPGVNKNILDFTSFGSS